MLTSGAVLPDIDYVEMQLGNKGSIDAKMYTTK